MNTLTKVASAVIVALALSQTQTIRAVPITGNIGFTGGVTYNTPSAGTATQVTSWITPTVSLAPSGTFSSIVPGSAATFANVIWNFNTAVPIFNFWSVGGFSFELLSSSIVVQGGGALGYVVVNGSGIVTSSNPAYDPTTISWSFSSQDPKIGTNPDTWTFSASANSFRTVPDGAHTVLLLGFALSGMALLRRKLVV
ncbi:MAG TPA: hypothetical protein VF988_13935 [Verrucomicrobiae bacterium]